ncbi:hypothetical protein TVAG_045050 [Trichomonas vaginalis G3]|uniref:Uncharacterized protein n=1 Tax=Trichomonas vaginalis (strain ATCC PRA-98 / G3) TaxID=412133 RepID=A2E8F3_TRIV3|nr:hypothetical protein TVAGG3_0550720 [Trichomonas vaginalis G3]EAY11081.1 hypothetical protein TVAG_045050 [Trichomonas vaginalis G3]KAI5520482.1 hypothetical protein TVAGG3_0550720 [Trichomonas vaginalis G3]|eukprot:XP_001323304.1 hypothetical protein [Trichomonas vaginalis G3]
MRESAYSAFLQNKRCQSRIIDESVTERSKTVRSARDNESKSQLDSKLEEILNKNAELEREFQNSRVIPRNSKKPQEIIEYHDFLTKFSDTSKYTEYRFRELLNRTESTHETLENQNENLLDVQRAAYRSEMGLDEKFNMGKKN